MSNVVKLSPFSDNMSSEQALHACLADAERGDVDEVLVLGFSKDGSLYLRHSHTTRSNALWMLMDAVDCIREIGRYAKTS